MKFLALTMNGLLLLSAAPAYAETAPTVCLTISQPSKWNAGLVLRIFANSDGTKSATLSQLSMFRGETSQDPRGQALGEIGGITSGKNGAGETIIAGGADGRSLNATLGAPDQYGAMTGSLDLKVAGMSIHTDGASITRFNGDAKCE